MMAAVLIMCLFIGVAVHLDYPLYDWNTALVKLFLNTVDCGRTSSLYTCCNILYASMADFCTHSAEISKPFTALHEQIPFSVGNCWQHIYCENYKSFRWKPTQWGSRFSEKLSTQSICMQLFDNIKKQRVSCDWFNFDWVPESIIHGFMFAALQRNGLYNNYFKFLGTIYNQSNVTVILD